MKDVNDLISDDEIEQSIDREYYVAAACDIFEYDGDMGKFFDAINKGIDKAIEAYTTNGKLVVEDWDMFDQDMRHYMESELEKI